jgi:gliding motility-associated-like protein
MSTLTRKLLFSGLLSTVSTFLLSQDVSNKGKDFWLGYGNHQQMYSDNGQGMAVYITSDANTNALVEIPGISFSQSVTVSAFQITTVTIPNTAVLDKEGKLNKGIHVKADKPVVLYAHIYYASVSGATLCLPVNTLGREYYAVNFKQVAQSNVSGNSYSYFFVTATEDNTTIEITPSVATLGGRPANAVFTEILNRGEVYQVLAKTDLTGSTIRSINNGTGCKRIAVFCGSGRIGIGCPNGDAGVSSSDNLFQQMYPTSTWGKKYITVPSANRPLNYYRIISPNPAAAKIRLNGALVGAASFTNGFYYDFQGTGTNLIESDQPILVAQYFTTQQCAEATGNGDPEMIYLNPVEQTINDVTLTSMRLINTGSNIHHINIVVKNMAAALNSIKLDGLNIGSGFISLPQDPSFAYRQMTVIPGTHRIVCDSGFNAIAYGFANTESYGYSAGTNLKDLYQYISVDNQYAVVNFPAGCKNSPLKFSMTFPYQPTQIKWLFNGLLPDTTITNPVFDSTWIINGRTLYRFKLKKLFTVSGSGTYPIKVIAINPTADGCTGEQEIDYDLQIFDPPVAGFSITNSGCITSPVVFHDGTNSAPRQIIGWYWNFGDGQTAAIKNPSHTYTRGGSFPVKFSVVTDVGCLSDTMSQQVSISAIPVAGFIIQGNTCENKPVVLVDQSTITPGSNIATWNWNFGDGSTLIATSNTAVQHNFPTAGSYNVSLLVEAEKGCKSNLQTSAVKISYLPKVAFSTPDICLNDPIAQFFDSSSIADNSEPQFIYSWNFGDGISSAQKNGRHKYAAVGIYNVKLTVTSKDGCVKDSTRPFTVNGAVPIANFTVNAVTELCSNREVSITDAATVDFGEIIKVEAYWDYLNDPTIKTMDANPASGKIYSHQYPESGTASDKQIRYIVYSGITCLHQSVKTILLKASPQIQFNSMQPVCEEIAPFTITAAREMNGLAGIGSYSGPGIDETGVFNPQVALPGLHNIKYHFDAINGCAADKTATILVHPTPLVDAGPDRVLLEGGYIVLDTRISGNKLSYLWTPGSFLDNDKIARPRVTTPEDISYSILVTSADGCKSSDDVLVKVLKQIKIPNAFSPNGDGVNDNWQIQYLDSYPGCTVNVYNRYGQLVYRSTGYAKAWDGRINGQPLPFGNYYWIINPGNGRSQMNGSVTIIR